MGCATTTEKPAATKRPLAHVWRETWVAGFVRRVAAHLATRRVERDIDKLPAHIRRDIGATESPEFQHRRDLDALRLHLDR